MEHLIVVGGGWAGCAAALAAAKKGLAVTLLERTDRLLASGLVGGIMRNNARYTAAEELILMGAGELPAITDDAARHRSLEFPGHRHASLYDVHQVERPVQQLLQRYGVRVSFESRVVDVEMQNGFLRAVRLNESDAVIAGTVFIDASGTAGPVRNCHRFGQGCAMCIYRCPTFGPRLSIAVKAGAAEMPIQRPEGELGYFSGSCELEPSTLAPGMLAEIRQKGVMVLPLPEDFAVSENNPAFNSKACRQYSSAEYKEKIVLLDTGAIKVMYPYLSLEELRRVEGLAGAVYRDPLGGGRGNSIRFTGLIRRDNRLQVPAFENLLVAGERAGRALGHTEAMVTGTLAGYNAYLISRGEEAVTLPRGTVSGELIALTDQDQKGESPEGHKSLYTLSGGLLWEYLRKNKLYTTDRSEIRRRLQNHGAIDLFA